MRRIKKVMTLGEVIKDGQILLGLMKRGPGEGRYNGFGGKVEKGETIENSLIREFKEEAGITIQRFDKIGVIQFYFEDSNTVMETHLFLITEYEGEPKESEEATPKWFPLDNIQYDLMWPDDFYWLPMLLRGQKFDGKFWFSDKKTIRKFEIKLK